MFISLLIFSGLGILVGILSGLLGVGGGIIIIPVMIFSLNALHFNSEIIMKLSLGTSFATIMLTSMSSIASHHRRGAVQWNLVKTLAPGIVLGVFTGGMLVSFLSNQTLKIIFALFMVFSAIKMLLPAPKTPRLVIKKLTNFSMLLWGLIIGFISALVGIGGGAITVPFLTTLGHNMRQAIATSAAVGFPIAVTGTFTAIFTGWQQTQWDTHHALGYVYLPGLLGIVITSIFFAPIGAKLAHTLPTSLIKKIFAYFLLIMLAKIIFE